VGAKQASRRAISRAFVAPTHLDLFSAERQRTYPNCRVTRISPAPNSASVHRSCPSYSNRAADLTSNRKRTGTPARLTHVLFGVGTRMARSLLIFTSKPPPTPLRLIELLNSLLRYLHHPDAAAHLFLRLISGASREIQLTSGYSGERNRQARVKARTTTVSTTAPSTATAMV